MLRVSPLAYENPLFSRPKRTAIEGQSLPEPRSHPTAYSHPATLDGVYDELPVAAVAAEGAYMELGSLDDSVNRVRVQPESPYFDVAPMPDAH